MKTQIILALLAITLAACAPVTTVAPLPPTAVRSLEESAAVKPQQPPACTFPLTQISTKESQPEEYTFSEPKVVLTAPEGNIYNLAEWLPNNQQILMTEELRNVVVGNSTPLLESISLYNPETGESKVYSIRQLTYEAPIWMSDSNAVIYSVLNFTYIDRKNQNDKFTRQIWVSYGNPDAAQMLADNLAQLPIAAKSDGSEILYLTDKKISKLDKSLKKISDSSFDYAQWDYGKGWRNKNPVTYRMAWQSNTALVFLYSSGGSMGGGGYTFILNTDNGNVCELDFGGWASGARWSSDGRYLAIGRATDSHPADLTLLDIQTGNLTTLRGAPQGVDGQLYLNDFIWAPDNRHLLALGSVHLSQNSQDGNNVTGFYLVDIVSGQSIHAVPEYKGFIFSGNNFAWSPDGSKVAIHCPTQTVDQICLIAVQSVGQQQRWYETQESIPCCFSARLVCFPTSASWYQSCDLRNTPLSFSRECPFSPGSSSVLPSRSAGFRCGSGCG
jgi:hypothetical protein